MSSVVNIGQYVKNLQKESASNLDSINIIIDTNQLIAMFYITNNQKAKARQRELNKILLDTLSVYLTDEFKADIPALYYSVYGLKSLIKCYENDVFMDKIGFKCFQNTGFNLVEYGKNAEPVDKRLKELNKGLEEWLKEKQ